VKKDALKNDGESSSADGGELLTSSLVYLASLSGLLVVVEGLGLVLGDDFALHRPTAIPLVSTLSAAVPHPKREKPHSAKCKRNMDARRTLRYKLPR
jgi:hypothetical protein